MNKNSNAYIIVYATVMVVVVAAVLALVAQGLKERQDRNVLNEKKGAILSSLGITGNEFDRLYEENVEGMVVDASGQRIEGYDAKAVIDLLGDLRGTFVEGKYPLFRSKEGVSVIPVIGKGLWGDVWGYIALAPDGNTISGTVFDHKSETPGLGAEITMPQFRDQFVGKTIFENGALVSIAVVKGGAPEGDPHAVDAISGGTLTSKGVEAMLLDGLKRYEPYLKRQAAGLEETNKVKEEGNE